MAVAFSALLANNARISNSEAQICGLSNGILANAKAAANGEIPLFAAHQAENQMVQQKLSAELTMEASKAMEDGNKKRAKEKIRRSFSSYF